MTQSIRDLLAAKQPRRAIVPVLVSDPSVDLTEMRGVSTALALAREREDADEVIVALATELELCGEKVQSHWVSIELQALAAADWEAAISAWQTIEVNEDGPTAVMDWAASLAPLLALSCTDPGLRDADWWREQLAGPSWSEGDLDALRAAVLALNIDAAEARAPKD